MTRITPQLIEEHLGPQRKISRLWLGGWWVELQSGASVKITQHRLNFGKFSAVENRTGIDEDLFQEEIVGCLRLGGDIWGGIGTYGGASQQDVAAFLTNCESLGLNTGDQGKVLRHFGPTATTKYTLNGFRVCKPDGAYVKVDCGAIEKVVGGDMLRSALAMVHEIAPDKVVVRGKAELLLMAVHEG